MKTSLKFLALFSAAALLATLGATALLSAFAISLVVLTAVTDYRRAPRLPYHATSLPLGPRPRPSSLPLAA